MSDIKIFVRTTGGSEERHGRWIDFEDPDQFRRELSYWMEQYNDPDWEATCYDGFPAGIDRILGRHPDPDDIGRLLEDIEEHGEAFVAWLTTTRTNLQYSTDEFLEAYCGEHDCGDDYARSLWEEVASDDVDLNKWPYSCIDWEAAWKELQQESYWIENGHVFRPV